MREIADLQEKYRKFIHERDWTKFQSPKNLSSALAVEASELLEIFMWLTESQSIHLTPSRLQQTKDEMADIFLYLIRLADILNIDLISATHDKFRKVEEKYPIDKAKEVAKSIEST